ncbi:Mediator of RNA polymerase II transcription subunit 6 [Saxophila tyrrhenica]|uniref:Mediator of RNA polymerase II transcription subunit 6 n=1 Tax=Saxophila tyrrhenica TaxID=1690608 RepID=A0AAV9NV54_9PEZI|nr:Mediator of RNA polymerase II transcription subunit 6 [Saxophila tyrrhenica]
MANPNRPPLDEIVHQRPDIIQYHLSQVPGVGPMDENMIHTYISESPFFDHATNNGLAFLQAKSNQQLFETTWNRAAFEEYLRKQRGVEFLITGDPVPVQQGQRQEGVGGWAGTGKTGVYNIKKQERNYVQGRGEELTTLGSYYLVGENMYQAPGVGDIVSNRLIAATNHLSSFLETASNLPAFDPSTGYTYPPHTTTVSKSASASGTDTPARSRSTSLVPGATDSQSLRSGSLAPDASSTTQASGTSAVDRAATRLLTQSLQLSMEFGSEYSDENPLHGTPGNFSFTHSAAAVKKKRAEEAAAEAAALAAKEAKAGAAAATTTNGEVAGPFGRKVASPPAVMTEAKSGVAGLKEREKERRGSKMDGSKVRRKKSKGVNAAVTPGGAGASGGS